MHKEIKDKIAQIEQNYTKLVTSLNDHTQIRSAEDFESVLAVAAQARVNALRSAVDQYLIKLEAAGGDAPTLVEVGQWLGVSPQASALAEMLDELPDEEAVILMQVIRRATEIAEAHGDEAAAAFVDQVIAEAREGFHRGVPAQGAVSIAEINEKLQQAAAEDSAEVLPIVAPEDQAVYSAAINDDASFGVHEQSPAEVMENVVNYVIQQFPERAFVEQKYGPDGTSVTISVFIPK